ncbi:MAG: zeta toxin family protein [Pirellulales bacterium]
MHELASCDFEFRQFPKQLLRDRIAELENILGMAQLPVDVQFTFEQAVVERYAGNLLGSREPSAVVVAGPQYGGKGLWVEQACRHLANTSPAAMLDLLEFAWLNPLVWRGSAEPREVVSVARHIGAALLDRVISERLNLVLETRLTDDADVESIATLQQRGYRVLLILPVVDLELRAQWRLVCHATWGFGDVPLEQLDRLGNWDMAATQFRIRVSQLLQRGVIEQVAVVSPDAKQRYLGDPLLDQDATETVLALIPGDINPIDELSVDSRQPQPQDISSSPAADESQRSPHSPSKVVKSVGRRYVKLAGFTKTEPRPEKLVEMSNAEGISKPASDDCSQPLSATPVPGSTLRERAAKVVLADVVKTTPVLETSTPAPQPSVKLEIANTTATEDHPPTDSLLNPADPYEHATSAGVRNSAQNNSSAVLGSANPGAATTQAADAGEARRRQLAQQIHDWAANRG